MNGKGNSANKSSNNNLTSPGDRTFDPDLQQVQYSGYLNQQIGSFHNQTPMQQQTQLPQLVDSSGIKDQNQSFIQQQKGAAGNQFKIPQTSPQKQQQIAYQYENALNNSSIQGGGSGFKMPNIAQKFNLKRTTDQSEEFELYEGSSQRFKPVQSVNLVDKFVEQRNLQQQQQQNQYGNNDTSRFSQSQPPQKQSPFSNNANTLSQKLGMALGGQLRNNFHSNDANVLQQKLAELEAELSGLDKEYEQLQVESEHLKEEQEDIKAKNKQLFEQITLMGGSAQGTFNESNAQDPNESMTMPGGGGLNKSVSSQVNGNDPQATQDNNIGEIHSLYQDLFLTDIKKEVETAQTELKQCKQEQNNAQREMTQLKKENQQLNATLKRYRKMLQELTNNKKDDLASMNFMSPTDLQKMHMMSFESVDPNAAQMQQQILQQQQQKPQNPLGNDQKKGGLKRSDSGTSSVTQLISQATFIETAKIERLLAALALIQNSDKVYEILMTSLRELKALVNCQNCTIFILNQELQKALTGVEKTDNINMQKFTMDGGVWIDALCENDKELSSPGFKKPEDAKYGLKTQQFLAQAVIFKDEEIVIIVQCEAKFNKKTNKFLGFQVADEQVLKIFCYYLQMRFERRIALREVKQKEQAVVDTLRLTSEICTQRHHEGLFRKMKENLPEFFGFESVGVLIYNFKTNWLFTDPDSVVKDHRPPAQQHNANNSHTQSANQIAMNSHKLVQQDSESDINYQQLSDKQQQKLKEEYCKDEGKTEEEKAQAAMAKVKEVHQKKFMNFPCNSGISGIVFQTGQIYISNNAAKETKFIDEIDNQSSITDVRNFMIGPVYGDRKDMPCGIIQFVNKVKGGQITPADENKFKAMQGLLGMCIDNTNEMSLTINVTLDVHDVMQKIQDIMKRDQQQEDEYEQSDAKLSNLGDNIKVIKETFNKLMDDRNKGKSVI